MNTTTENYLGQLLELQLELEKLQAHVLMCRLTDKPSPTQSIETVDPVLTPLTR
ncbi:MAG: hypothetical protein H7Y22_07205 [Gemmatimonadaceae bacterium]|nr:hypothetical protein [Gloeobacterales cyanobacterium ES-bin-141]